MTENKLNTQLQVSSEHIIQNTFLLTTSDKGKKKKCIRVAFSAFLVKVTTDCQQDGTINKERLLKQLFVGMSL